ncbi:galactokinase [Halanaerobacter jeridensis]|uniref:Galactokinase n=1 Tax=Halanaerobacter jeridensis TaxID=706427 RepID=A0A938XRX2_9FIRM|nr:galactokinase [Halanaerobacter jeridensis]MBM7556664.1 galactokinase [Halanaerobacter jeridensis]
MKSKELTEELFNNFGNNKNKIKIAQAPGRVNLIGGHTDYNDGFVLPVAINREVTIAAQARNDKEVKAYSLDFDKEVSFSLTEISYNQQEGWINYLQGVAKFLMEDGYQLQGMNLVITGNVPQGAGLSSSAALEVATALIFELVNEFTLDRVKMAKICQRAENEFVGVSCGIMDQFISALGKKDNTLFVDCRTNEYQLTPIENSEIKIVVANTNVEHSLVDSAYNQRLEESHRGVDKFNQLLDKKIKALRDVSPAEFEKYKPELPPVVRKRCEHVIYENERVLQAKESLQAGDLAQVGELITASHQSLKNLYEVSCQELDLMVDLALDIDGVLGARMTGAGFGGSTVNLVKEEAVAEFKNKVAQQYQEQTGIEPDVYVCNIEDGAHEISLTGQVYDSVI